MGLLSWFTRHRQRKQRVRADSLSLLSSTRVPSAPLEVVEGRLMLSTASYALPKDGQEINRLDLQHFIVRSVLQGNYRAPIRQPKAILDVGTGTGRWAQEMARAFPGAQVIGCDLMEVEIGKDAGLIPANYQFRIGDVLKRLPFDDHSFDFVHQRLLIMGIPTALWPQDIAELVRVNKQGGWVEIVESETQALNPGPTTQRFSEMVAEASKKRGIDSSSVPWLGAMMQEAGLINIETASVKIPIGKWGGRLGTMMAANLVAGGMALKPLIVSQGLIASENFERMYAVVQREWEDYHSMLPVYIAYGQRP